ncbi:MAG: substrate-binding domain-containing protein [Chloroflexi bacterium]|jgi:DNA-binding LacI/PurR family transcriptional regulator|nr:substrate-binding domain-containing protein [Chloroflexota bacterium]
MPRKKVTSIDVAKLAGVSQPTVSRALDPGSPVSPETRARVLAIASELGYTPNVIARSLKSQSTNIIGIVMSNLASSFFSNNVLEQFAHQLQALGKQLLLFSAPPDRPVDEILPQVLGYQVDALIITSSTPGQAIIDECARIGTPVILFNRFAPGTQANVVGCDNEEGGRQVANVLLDAGHQRIAYMAGTSGTASNLMREKGFMDQLKTRGYVECMRENGFYSYEAGRTAARSLLDRDDPPDAIFCAADVMALGALDVARYELGIQVPEDLSIIGFDDIPLASWPAYNLTTIHQPINRMISAALELVTYNEDDFPIRQITLLPGELVIRGSARIA